MQKSCRVLTAFVPMLKGFVFVKVEATLYKDIPVVSLAIFNLSIVVCPIPLAG